MNIVSHFWETAVASGSFALYNFTGFYISFFGENLYSCAF